MTKRKRRGKLPVHLRLEVKQYPPARGDWYEVTGVLSWEPVGYTKRMDSLRCTGEELPETKAAITYLVRHTFQVKSVTEQKEVLHD